MNSIYRSLCQDLPEDSVDSKTQGRGDRSPMSVDTHTTYDFQYLEIDRSVAGDFTSITDLSKFRCALPLYPVSKVL